MNISFLTTDEPLFLPKFFEHVLPALSRRHTVRVYSVPRSIKRSRSEAPVIPRDALRLLFQQQYPIFCSPNAAGRPINNGDRRFKTST
jgi:hypothetical protein